MAEGAQPGVVSLNTRIGQEASDIILYRGIQIRKRSIRADAEEEGKEVNEPKGDEFEQIGNNNESSTIKRAQSSLGERENENEKDEVRSLTKEKSFAKSFGENDIEENLGNPNEQPVDA